MRQPEIVDGPVADDEPEPAMSRPERAPREPTPVPPLFADFTVPEFGPPAELQSDPSSVEEGGWPEPAPPHPFLQPGAQVVDRPVAAGPAAPESEADAEPSAKPTAPIASSLPGTRDSEDDAMRAIEGGWSGRRRGRADQPELIDVSSAVAAAQSAVAQVLAQTGESARDDQGKPQGLPRARGGARDDLLLISGLSPLDESTLNNLGVFHFDQIAAWSDAEVLWLENHAFARDRIGREDWQRQARTLSNQRPAPPPRVARS